MKELIDNILNSFNNNNTGFSGKKLSAFAIILCVLVAHGKWIILGDFSQLVTVLVTDFTFISTMFGINEYGKTKTKE